MGEQIGFGNRLTDKPAGSERNFQNDAAAHQPWLDFYKQRMQDYEPAKPTFKNTDIGHQLDLNTAALYKGFDSTGPSIPNRSGFNENLIPFTDTASILKANTVPAQGKGTKPDAVITDCSAGCTINGKTYYDKFEIPGFDPKMLIGPDKKPVHGPDGKTIFGPSAASIKEIGDKFAQNPVRGFVNFGYNAPWDYQRRMTDDGKQIFYGEYKDFTNIAVGFGAANAHIPRVFTTGLAALYAWKNNSKFKEPMSPVYKYIPERNVRDYEIGYDLRKRTLARRDDMPDPQVHLTQSQRPSDRL